MSEIIEKYYSDTKVLPFIIQRKLAIFEKHPDIAAEFEFWITNKVYRADGVCIEGYSAKKLADLSKYVDGEAAFILLAELRENPEKAKKRIKEGFLLK